MNLGRILGGILSLVFAISFINNIDDISDSNPFELIGDNGIVTEESIEIDNYFIEGNNSNVEIIKYTNNQPYSVSLTTSNIRLDCNGLNERDVELVKNNMKVSSSFSRLNSKDRLSNINIKPKGTIYINVINDYNGELPSSDVTCEYSIDIQDF